MGTDLRAARRRAVDRCVRRAWPASWIPVAHLLLAAYTSAAMTTPAESLFEHVRGDDAARAEVAIDVSRRAGQPINPLLYAKFCEHLGSNVYNGMDAQILLNPTFGQWTFSAGDDASNSASRTCSSRGSATSCRTTSTRCVALPSVLSAWKTRSAIA